MADAGMAVPRTHDLAFLLGVERAYKVYGRRSERILAEWTAQVDKVLPTFEDLQRDLREWRLEGNNSEERNQSRMKRKRIVQKMIDLLLRNAEITLATQAFGSPDGMADRLRQVIAQIDQENAPVRTARDGVFRIHLYYWFGWPFFSTYRFYELEGSQWSPRSDSLDRSALPLMLGPGAVRFPVRFAGNVVVFTLLCMMVIEILRLIVAAAQRGYKRLRQQPHGCPGCGYSAQGRSGVVCPECGLSYRVSDRHQI
jgi:hypothetical protein